MFHCVFLKVQVFVLLVDQQQLLLLLEWPQVLYPMKLLG